MTINSAAFSNLPYPAKTEVKEKKPGIGIGVILSKNGKILLGKRKGSHGAATWAPPGGHLEFGETVEECAKRELLEETGLTALSIRLGPWTEDIMEKDKKHYVTIFVFIEDYEGNLQLLEPEKCEGWEWFSWDNLPEPLFPTVKSLICKLAQDN